MDRRFALAGLMRVRELQEERAAAELALANRRKHEAEFARSVLRDTLAHQVFPAEALADRIDQPHNIELSQDEPTWRAVVAARAAVTAMLTESTHALRNATETADAAAEDWAHAKMRAAMIDKLRARHERALESEELREEQIVLDEAALRRTMEVNP